jgi:hypothetical protein
VSGLSGALLRAKRGRTSVAPYHSLRYMASCPMRVAALKVEDIETSCRSMRCAKLWREGITSGGLSWQRLRGGLTVSRHVRVARLGQTWHNPLHDNRGSGPENVAWWRGNYGGERKEGPPVILATHSRALGSRIRPHFCILENPLTDLQIPYFQNIPFGVVRGATHLFLPAGNGTESRRPRAWDMTVKA